ncbi:MAG: VCBS repeat-containing protein, partial [Chlorobium sp.]|nr:VCBS repeat-containing protein [Chlorobium sp.]
MNGDSNLDLITANQGSNTVSVLTGKVDGTFNTQVTYATGSGPYSVTTGDVNGDNKLDLLVANSGSNTVSVLTGKVDGTFNAQVTYATGSYPISVTTGDVNGDNKLDLLVANFMSNSVSVLTGNSNGTFNPQATYALGSYPYSVIAGDVNGDNKLDLLVAEQGSNTVSVLTGKGDGTFNAQVTYAAGLWPGSIATGDVNGDHKLDLVVANSDSNNVSVLLNNGGKIAFTEGDAPVVINSGISISDPDNLTLASGTVSITSGFQNGADVLAFTNNGLTMGNIAGLYNQQTGILSLTSENASATVAQWQAALASVTYVNTSDSPNVAERMIAFTVNDGMVSSAIASQAVTVTEVNDTPVVATMDVTGGVTELPTPVDNLIDSGTISFTDADLTDAHSVSAVTASTGALGTLTPTITTDTTGTGLGGVVTWNYSVAASAVEYLAKEQTKEETFTFSLLDGHGGSVERTVNVTITGTNDTPVVATTDVTGRVTKMPIPVDSLTDSGTISFTDADLTDVHGISAVTASAGALGTLTPVITTDTIGSGVGGLVTWDYSVATSAVEYLAEGEEKVETFTFSLLDGQGGSVERTVSVTIASIYPPILLSSTPADNAATVAVGSNIVLTFSEAVQAGTGDIIISNGSDSRTIAITDSNQVTISGNTVTINPTDNLHAGSNYNVQVDNGAIKDVTGNAYAGISNTTTLNFTTNSAPIVTDGVSPTLSFANQVPYLTGTRPSSVTTGDVNSDHKLDLIVANEGSSSVSVLTGNGNGTFNDQATYATGSYPSSVKAGDVNGDNKLDLIVANGGGNTVSVLIGNGNGTGTFNDQATYATGGGPSSVTTGDVNGDNKLDLLVANWGNNTVSVLIGNSNGTFNPQNTYAVDLYPYSVSTGDVNGDNQLELITVNAGSNTVSVLTGNGNGTFNAQTTYETGDFPISLTTADVNGDNKLDLLVANYSNDTVSVLMGTGVGTFNAQVTYAAGSNPRSVATGDVNGDNKLDLIVANFNSNSVSVLTGNGNGTFNDQVTYATGWNPLSVTTGDVNGDNQLDLLVANWDSNSVSVLLNNSAIATAFTEGDAPVFINSSILVSDPDNLTLASGTVSIGSGFQSGEDVLAFTNNGATMGNIAGVYDQQTGILSLLSANASATVAEWQAALASVTYANTSDSPSTAGRVVAFMVNDGIDSSIIANRTVTVTGVNDVPVVATMDVTSAITEMDTPSGNLTDSGTISFTDVDLTDVHSVSTVTASAGALGTLIPTITTDTTGSGLGGVVTWNYSVAA